MDFSFSRSSSPLNTAMFPFFAGDAQVCLTAGEQLGDAPLGHDLAEQGVGAVPVGGGHPPRTTSRLHKGRDRSRYKNRWAVNTLLPLPAPP